MNSLIAIITTINHQQLCEHSIFPIRGALSSLHSHLYYLFCHQELIVINIFDWPQTYLSVERSSHVFPRNVRFHNPLVFSSNMGKSFKMQTDNAECDCDVLFAWHCTKPRTYSPCIGFPWSQLQFAVNYGKEQQSCRRIPIFVIYLFRYCFTLIQH